MKQRYFKPNKYNTRQEVLKPIVLNLGGDNNMSETPAVGQPSKEDLVRVKELFGLSHDLLSQASFPGHISMKVAESLNFLKFHYTSMDEAIKKLDVPKVEAELVNPVTISEPAL